MNNKIYKYDTLKFNKILFGKEQIYENNSYIPIYIKDNNKINILNIKTCKLFVPHNIISQSKYYLTMELLFLNLEKDKQLEKFYNVIIKLEKCIKNKFKKVFKNKKFISIIKESFNSKKIYVSLNSNNNNFIDINYEKIDKLKINTPTNGYFVINFRNIWFNNEKWGINVFLYSALLLPSQKKNESNLELGKIKNIFKEELDYISSDKEDNKDFIKNDPIYSKFFKLKSMKVPIIAIKHKMILSNLEPSILDYNGDTLTKNIFKNKNNKNDKIKSNDILNNRHKLKKTVINEKIKIKRNNLKIPSLEEIQNQIKKMKNNK